MTIGTQTSAQTLNAQLTGYATNWRNQAQNFLNWWKTVEHLGVTGLQTEMGMGSADAAAFYSAANYLQTNAAIFFGQATQGSAFNFDDELGVQLGVYGGN